MTFPLAPAIALVALGAFISAGFIRDIYFALKSKQWPTTTGKVVDLNVVGSPLIQSNYSSAVVGYEYEVRGIRYTSKRIDYAGRGGSLGRWTRPARNYLRRYYEGQSIPVRYDPNQPKRAVLETGVTLGNFLRLLCGLLSSRSASSRSLRANERCSSRALAAELRRKGPWPVGSPAAKK
jgi:hypothetical protein